MMGLLGAPSVSGKLSDAVHVWVDHLVMPITLP